ncbi:hypothetical protein JRQ81_014158 [Phrynocephalus forsythii]|uniref:Uncharacterized protein n=1 Tax=Phrynocephalus forsythii TaxID=171643 RepID=A0A9Q1B3D9_9SAUR|nr:hypothetical protein JRQ81_014158 [Phrynocephalus forsythii]
MVVKSKPPHGATGNFLSKTGAKKAVAKTKLAHFGELYRNLVMHEGECDIYQLVKVRHKRTEDIERFSSVNDENGNLINDRVKATIC